MPRPINVGDAKARLSHLIARAEAGEDVVIARDGVPAARLVSVNVPLGETIDLLRRERARRARVSRAEVRAARQQGRA